MENRRCTSCSKAAGRDVFKPIEEFIKYAKSRDGIGFYCVACRRVTQAATKVKQEKGLIKPRRPTLYIRHHKAFLTDAPPKWATCLGNNCTAQVDRNRQYLCNPCKGANAHKGEVEGTISRVKTRSRQE